MRFPARSRCQQKRILIFSFPKRIAFADATESLLFPDFSLQKRIAFAFAGSGSPINQEQLVAQDSSKPIPRLQLCESDPVAHLGTPANAEGPCVSSGLLLALCGRAIPVCRQFWLAGLERKRRQEIVFFVAFQALLHALLRLRGLDLRFQARNGGGIKVWRSPRRTGSSAPAAH